MQIRSRGATALNLLLVSSLLLAAGNELLCGELLCCEDETDRHEVATGASDSGLRLTPADEEHEDDCLCCGLRNQRPSLDPSEANAPALKIAEVAPARHDTFFVDSVPSSHSSRGPPTR